MFYGTGIATYVWILDTNKDPERQGKIQLIDASDLWEPMGKGMGDKRRQMTEKRRLVVHEAYKAFEDADPAISRVMVKEDFMFRDVPVFKQARLATRFSDEAVSRASEHRSWSDEYVEIMRGLDGFVWNSLPDAFKQRCKNAGLKAPLGLVDAVCAAMGVQDDDAPLAVDRKGKAVLVDGWKITERVPMSEDLDEHMAREVLPFAEGATWDEDKAKEGNEIPFTRIFYVPEEPRALEDIDADVARLMGELGVMFEAVHKDA
jgi:type I restriction enzyme M protein